MASSNSADSTRHHILKLVFLDNTSMHIPLNYLLELSDEPWFLKNLIEDVDGDYAKSNIDELSIFESRENVVSVLETLKSKQLCLQDNVNLNYFRYLADKWCLPQWVLETIDKKIEEQEGAKRKMKSMCHNFTKNITLKCNNCRVGYNIYNNSETACFHHPSGFDNQGQYWYCCRGDARSKGCRIGYHCPEDVSNYIIVYDILEKERSLNS